MEVCSAAKKVTMSLICLSGKLTRSRTVLRYLSRAVAPQAGTPKDNRYAMLQCGVEHVAVYVGWRGNWIIDLGTCHGIRLAGGGPDR